MSLNLFLLDQKIVRAAVKFYRNRESVKVAKKKQNDARLSNRCTGGTVFECHKITDDPLRWCHNCRANHPHSIALANAIHYHDKVTRELTKLCEQRIRVTGEGK